MRIGVSVIRVAAVAALLATGAVGAMWADDGAVDAQAAAERLAGAIRFETISHDDQANQDPAPFLALHQYLAETFPRVHATLTRETVHDLSLLYTWEGSNADAQPFLLTSHIDVVPVPEDTRDQWTLPPFDRTLADGFIWGRGALDNKSGVLATLEAVEALLAEGYTPTRRIYFAFGHDEEVGGPEGAAGITALLEERGEHVEFTLDEGMAVLSGIIPGVSTHIALIGIAEKGSTTLTLTAHAPGGHSSMPPRESAIGRLSAAIQRLEASPMPVHLDEGPAALMFDAVGPHVNFPLSTIIGNRRLFGPLLVSRLEKAAYTNAMMRTTTAVTIIRAGVKRNVLPGKAVATVNFRLLPGDTVDDVVAHVRTAIADPKIDIEVLHRREASPVSAHDSRAFGQIAQSVQTAMPDVAVVAPALVIGGTDSKHYAKIAENSYRFLPARIEKEDTARFHGVNERIGITNYGEMIGFYRALIQSAAR